MGLRRRFRDFRDWCPQPPNPLPTNLKRYSATIAVVLAVTVLSAALFTVSSSYLLGSSVKTLPILPLSAQKTSASPNIAQLWNLSIGLQSGSPTFSNGYLYAESAVLNGNAYCLNASTGTQIWSFPLGDTDLSSFFPYGFIFSPVVSGAYVYAGASIAINIGYYDVIYCLNALTGAELWNFTYGPSTANYAPAVANGYVYAVSGFPSKVDVYALNAATGASVWNFTTGATIESSPTVANNVLYVSSGSTVFALNGVTGTEIWNYPTGNTAASATISNGVVYFASGNLLYALDAESGTQIWNASTPQTIATDSPPAVANNLVYVSSNDTVYCFYTLSGAQAWNQATAGTATSPVISSGNVYLGSNGVSVYCLNASTGDKAWNVTALPHLTAMYMDFTENQIFPGMGPIQGGPILYSPTVVDDTVYISLSASAFTSPNGGDVTNVGIIFALGPATTLTPSPTPSPSPTSSNNLTIIIGVVVAVVIVAALVFLMFLRKKGFTSKIRSE